ncbi:MAG: Uma2 family endonuclease [Planctomycetota bacterium]
MSRVTGTALFLGPADHGRALSRAQYERASYAPGHDCELVAGRLYVSLKPNFRHARVGGYLNALLNAYSQGHSGALNFVTSGARLITNALGGETDPEPDVAGYRGLELDPDRLSWEGIYPVLVVEVVSLTDPAKDFERNRQLYWEVPSIEEYWIVDPRELPPTLLALVRGPEGWIEHPVEAGGHYASSCFPGLELDLAEIFGSGS